MAEFAYNKPTRKRATASVFGTLDTSIIEQLETYNMDILEGYQTLLQELDTLDPPEAPRPPPPEVAETRLLSQEAQNDNDAILMDVMRNLIAGDNPFPDDHTAQARMMLIDEHEVNEQERQNYAQRVAKLVNDHHRIVQPIFTARPEVESGYVKLKNISVTILSASTALLVGYVTIYANLAPGLSVDIAYRVFITIRSISAARNIDEAIEIFIKTGARNIVEFSVGMGIRQGASKLLGDSNMFKYISSQVIIRILQNGVQVFLNNPRFLGITAVERELAAQEEQRRLLREQREEFQRISRYVSDGPSDWDRFRDATYEKYNKIVKVADNHPYITTMLAILGSSVIATRLIPMIPEYINEKMTDNKVLKFFIGALLSKEAIDMRIIRGKLLPFICEKIEEASHIQRRVMTIIREHIIRLDSREMLDFDRLLRREFTTKILVKNILAQLLGVTSAVITEEMLLSAVQVDYVALAKTDFGKKMEEFMAMHKYLDIDAVSSVFANLVNAQFAAGHDFVKSLTGAVDRLKSLFSSNTFTTTHNMPERDISQEPGGPEERAGPEERTGPEESASRTREDEGRKAYEGAQNIMMKIENYEHLTEEYKNRSKELLTEVQELLRAKGEITSILNDYSAIINAEQVDQLQESIKDIDQFLSGDAIRYAESLHDISTGTSAALDELHHAYFNGLWDVNVAEPGNLPALPPNPQLVDIGGIKSSLNEKLEALSRLNALADSVGKGDITRAMDTRTLSTKELDNISAFIESYKNFDDNSKSYREARAYLEKFINSSIGLSTELTEAMELLDIRRQHTEIMRVYKRFDKFFADLAKNPRQACNDIPGKSYTNTFKDLQKYMDVAEKRMNLLRTNIEQRLDDERYKVSLTYGLDISKSQMDKLQTNLQSGDVSRAQADAIVTDLRKLINIRDKTAASMAALNLDAKIGEARYLRTLTSTSNKATADNTEDILRGLIAVGDGLKKDINAVNDGIDKVINGGRVRIDDIAENIDRNTAEITRLSNRMLLAQRAFIRASRLVHTDTEQVITADMHREGDGTATQQEPLNGEEIASMEGAKIQLDRKMTNIIDKLQGHAEFLPPTLRESLRNVLDIGLGIRLDTDQARAFLQAYEQHLLSVPDNLRGATRIALELPTDSDYLNSININSIYQMQQDGVNTITSTIAKSVLSAAGSGVYGAATAAKVFTDTLLTGDYVGAALHSVEGVSRAGAISGAIKTGASAAGQYIAGFWGNAAGAAVGSVTGAAAEAGVSYGASAAIAANTLLNKHGNALDAATGFLSTSDNQAARIIADNIHRVTRAAAAEQNKGKVNIPGLLLKAFLNTDTAKGIYDGLVPSIVNSGRDISGLMERRKGRTGATGFIADFADAARTSYNVGDHIISAYSGISDAALRNPDMFSVIFGDTFRLPTTANIASLPTLGRLAEAAGFTEQGTSHVEQFNTWARQNIGKIVANADAGTLHPSLQHLADQARSLLKDRRERL